MGLYASVVSSPQKGVLRESGVSKPQYGVPLPDTHRSEILELLLSFALG